MNEVQALAEKIRKSFFSSFTWFDRDPKSIYISTLPFCLRRQFFNIKFNAFPVQSSDMVLGSIFHLSLSQLDVFKDAKFEVPVSAELQNGYRLSGRADVVTEDAVYEFKFTRRLDSIELDPFYFAQANAYAVLLERPKFYLVKVQRTSFDVKVLESEADTNAFLVLKKRGSYLAECLENDEIPNGPEAEWECTRCAYRVVCSQLGDKDDVSKVR